MLTLLSILRLEIPAKQLTLQRLEQKHIVFKEVERKCLEVVHFVTHNSDVVVELGRYLIEIRRLEELKLLSNELTTLLNNQ